MFQGSRNMVFCNYSIIRSLETLYHGSTQSASQEGIFAQGFTSPSPPWVTGHIHHRGKHKACTSAAGLPCRMAVNFSYECCIPCTTQPDSMRKYIHLLRQKSM